MGYIDVNSGRRYEFAVERWSRPERNTRGEAAACSCVSVSSDSLSLTSLIMCPHPEHANNVFLLEDLVDHSMLDVDPA